MMMTGMMKVMALVGGLGMAGGAATAGARPATMFRDVRHGIQQMQLTAEQKTEIRGVLKAHRAEARAAGDRLREAWLAVTEAERQQPLDEALIRQRAADASAAVGDLVVIHAHVRSEIRGLLTDEQRRKADALHDRILEDVSELRQVARAFVERRFETE